MAGQDKTLTIRVGARADASLNAVGGAVDKAFGKLKTAAKNVAIATGAAAGAAVTGAVKVGSSFESQMSTVQAISGSGAKQMEQLKAKAAEMGATTKFSATEAGQAMEYMAMAGWKTGDMMNGIEGIMNLAAASGEDLATTSDIVTDALTAFGLKAEDSGHFSDVLAAASSNANTNVSMLGESFKYVAPMAGAMKYSVEDVSLALGLMANAGVKSSMAGTSLKTAIANMSAPTAKMEATMKKYNISLKDNHGKMKPFKTVLDDLRGSIGDLSEEEQTAAAKNIFGKEAMAGMLNIINASEKDYRKLTKAVQNASGATKEMADTRLDNLEGDVTIFKSALEGKGIELYNEIKEPLRTAVQEATEILSDIDVAAVVDGFMDMGEAVMEFAEPLLKVGGWLMDNPEVIAGTLSGIGSAIVTFKVVEGLRNTAGAVKVLGSAFKGHPIIMGLSAAVGAIGAVGGAVKAAKKKAESASLDEHFGDVALSMDEIRVAAARVVGGGQLKAAEELLNSIEVSDDLLADLDKVKESLNKVNWKFSIGIKLDKEEMGEYEKDVNSYVENAQKLIDNKGYEISVATKFLFKDSKAGKTLTEENNDFYQLLSHQADGLSKQINKKLKKAMKDGLTVDLQEEINGLLEQLNKITDAITEAESEAEWESMRIKWSGKDLDADSYLKMQKEVADNVEKQDEGAYAALNESISYYKVKRKWGNISEEKYQTEVANAQKVYNERKLEARTRAAEFGWNTMMDTYGQELATGEYKGGDTDAILKSVDWIKEYADGTKYAAKLDDLDAVIYKKQHGAYERAWDLPAAKVEGEGDRLGFNSPKFPAEKNIQEEAMKHVSGDTADDNNNFPTKNTPLKIQEPIKVQGIGEKGGGVPYETQTVKNGNNEEVPMLTAGKSRTDIISQEEIEETRSQLKTIPEEYQKVENDLSSSPLDFTKCLVTPAEKGSKEASDTIRTTMQTELASGVTVDNVPVTINGNFSTKITPREKGGGVPYETQMVENGDNGKTPIVTTGKPRKTGKRLKEGHAAGTISRREHMAWVSEGDSMEAIIPINNSERSRGLYEKTGELLGYGRTREKTAYAPTFSPQIHITVEGGSSPQETAGLTAKEVDKRIRAFWREIEAKDRRYNLRR